MKRRLIRIALLGCIGVVLLAAALVVILLRNPGSLTDWIGSQLQDVANGYLNPKLSFTDLTYTAPLTVSLDNLRLTSDDPANPGHTIDIIACKHAEIALAEIPSIGKPIVIEDIKLVQPLISAIAVAPGAKKFVGFDDLVRGGSTASTTTDTTAPKPRQKLSDVFRMRLVQIQDGTIVYNPRIPDTVPMQLNQINTDLKIGPSEGGWYKLDTNIARKPVFNLDFKGELNLDSFAVRDVNIDILADLSQGNLSFLPPEIQEILNQYEARGKLNISLIKASLPLLDPLSGQADIQVGLTKANLALHGLRIPVDSLELEAAYADNKISLPKLEIDAIGGSADLTGSLVLNDRLDAALRLNIFGMVPQKLIADRKLASPYPAKVSLDLNVATSLLSMIGKAEPLLGVPLASIGLKDFYVNADDPANPGQRLDVIACRNLQVSMTKPILPDQPIVLDSILLQEPTISAVSISPGSTTFVGVPNVPATENSNSSTTTAPAESPKSTAPIRPSDLFRVKSFILRSAKLIYDPRIPGTERMCLSPVNTTVNIDPDNPGAYLVDAHISREPAFDLGIRGKVDLDHPALQDVNVDLRADLTGNQLDYLPPQVQLLLHRTRAKARLDFHGGGSVALADLSHAEAKIDTSVQNIDLKQGDINVPIKELSISAHLQDGKIVQDTHIAALNNEFDATGSIALNKRLDTDVNLSLKDIKLEPLMAALHPDKPVLTSVTTLNADIELKSPLMIAMGAYAKPADEPIASLDIRNFRLTTDDPLNPGNTFDFFACTDLFASQSQIPAVGKPLVIDELSIDRPAIRAIATGPNSKDFAGFVALQNMAAEQAPPATESAQPVATTQPAASPPVKISSIIQLRQFTLSRASLYYDPRLDSESDTTHPTIPLSFEQVALNAKLSSMAGDAYDFDGVLPSRPDFNLDFAGNFNVDTLVLHLSDLNLTTNLASQNPKYLPPQVQAMLPKYSPQGQLSLKASGDLPINDLNAFQFKTDLKLDDFKGTFGSFRIPVAHLRLPLHLTRGQIDILDSSSLGGPTIEALSGFLNLTGSVALNDRVDSTLNAHIDGMKLQDLMACKTPPSTKEIIGTVRADIMIRNAPLVLIANAASNVPPPPPADAPPPPEPPIADATTPATYASDLPDTWGAASVDLSQARLAGLELIQGISNIAKSAFANVFEGKKDEKENVVPKENAHLVFTCDKDRLDFSAIHYEGEVVAADGKGWITLSQQLDLVLTGGLIQKLGGMGAVGDWIKQAADSLLYYHVYGSFNNIQYKVKRGDGKPITDAVAKGAKQGEKYIGIGINKAGEGIDQAGKFLGGLFGGHKKKHEDAQTQPSDQ